MLLEKGSIDMVLVPSGLVLMFGYHLILLYRVLRFPHTTVIGFENHNKKAWVERMLRGGASEASLALSVVAANISTSTTLASLSLALCSFIGAWVGNSSKVLLPEMIYGDRSLSTNSVKYIALVGCFLLAFTSLVQAARYYVHASFLITTMDSDIPVGYVQKAVIRGGNFFTVGLRLQYLAATLLLWVFGPIPMLASSLVIVITLGIFDNNTTPLHHFRYDHFSGKEGKAPATAVNQATHASSSNVDNILNHPLIYAAPSTMSS
ncbi:hypothetical protein Taro_035914 [Colocasia esculenta]|uniref:Uncharacterized protein n=1 Tax=Colocasia esculenta TaxID=4460 RepID=A0A843WEN5_COLES|nr:hypothetical protein [Colocasia esculenta]